MEADRSIPGLDTTRGDREFAIEHLEALRKDMRDEIKQRIKQRDQYSIQLTVALAALISIAVTTTTTWTNITQISEISIASFAHRVLIAAPLISIYFTTLVLYSYRVHKIIANYLREEIEPELAELCGTPVEKEWEGYYCANAVPGIRRAFFIGSLWIVTVASPLYVGFMENWQGKFILPLIILGAIYLMVTIWITRTFWKK